MNSTLNELKVALEQVIAQITATVQSDEPLGNAQGHWAFPGLTRSELIEESQSLIELIEEITTENLGDHDARLRDYVRRLQFLQNQTVGQLWGNAHQAVPAYLFTLQGLRKSLSSLPTKTAVEASVKLKHLTGQIRGMEARINALEPRTGTLSNMVERIERASTAADQLPADLEALHEARSKIAELAESASRDNAEIRRLKEHSVRVGEELGSSAAEAKVVLERCETAYSAATSVGLAAAFSERSKSLSGSMWIWVVGLIIALGAGIVLGSNRLQALSEFFKIANTSDTLVALNLLQSALLVGAPVWFAWLATRQIGQRFRLAEDYAFKASVSRAYEGFRREASRIDKDMEAKLLTSALNRLDELPLRLVEADSPGSPWHELANSRVVKQALEAVPGFTEQIKELAGRALTPISVRAMQGTRSESKGVE